MSVPFVLVHGSATGAWFWKWVSNGLQRAGAEVLAPDLLGYGEAPPAPASGYDFGLEVAHLQRWLDARGVSTFHLVAHSMGASIALPLRLAAGASRVRSLVLVDPLVVGILADADPAADRETREAYARLQAVWPDREAAAAAFTNFWNGDDAWSRLGARARAMQIALVDKVVLELEAAATWRPSVDDLATGAPPTTILVGEHTRGGPRATSRVFGAALGAEVRVVEEAGHAIPLTHATAVVEACLHTAARVT